MNNPPFTAATPRVRRKRRQPTSSPPAALVLVAAVYDKDAYTLTLTFDRPISIADYDGDAITVNDDAQMGLSFDATGSAAVTSPDTAVLGLVEVGPSTGSGQTLTASAGTGIVAADDGGTWAGVSALSLPFP